MTGGNDVVHVLRKLAADPHLSIYWQRRLRGVRAAAQVNDHQIGELCFAQNNRLSGNTWSIVFSFVVNGWVVPAKEVAETFDAVCRVLVNNEQEVLG